MTAPLPHPVPVAPAAAAAPVANPAMVPQRPLSVAPPPAMSPSSPVSHAPPIALPRPPMPPPRPSARSPITPPPRNTPDPSSTAAPALYLHFNNEKFTIDKDQFIIGRGTKSSDLPIKDGNISRKHAAVIRRNGTYYIKDLGSTNGIDYKGMRIDNKRIDEGDIFHLCDYELRFTYQG